MLTTQIILRVVATPKGFPELKEPRRPFVAAEDGRLHLASRLDLLRMAITNSGAPTLLDVARLADVSLKTASRVLNNARVSENKVLRVRAAMKRLSYQPNELARGLKAQRPAAIGMVVPSLSDPFNANVVNAVQEVARANGFVLILASSRGAVEIERSEIVSLVGRQIDGLIVVPADSRTNTFRDVVPSVVPVVTCDQQLRDADVDCVTVTNRHSAREATTHLLSHGYRRIVAIGIKPHLFTFKERVAGYRAGMRAASLEPRACFVEHESMLTAKWFKEQVLDLHQADAILTLNSVCTIAGLQCLRDLGSVTGRDLPVLSFDDFDLANMLTPRLSVVVQPTELLGREAANLLFERLRGASGKSRTVVLQTALTLRESCGCNAPA